VGVLLSLSDFGAEPGLGDIARALTAGGTGRLEVM
jgi:hypothetical protein